MKKFLLTLALFCASFAQAATYENSELKMPMSELLGLTVTPPHTVSAGGFTFDVYSNASNDKSLFDKIKSYKGPRYTETVTFRFDDPEISHPKQKDGINSAGGTLDLVDSTSEKFAFTVKVTRTKN